jgi:hypothetical protein
MVNTTKSRLYKKGYNKPKKVRTISYSYNLNNTYFIKLDEDERIKLLAVLNIALGYSNYFTVSCIKTMRNLAATLRKLAKNNKLNIER